MLVSNDSAPGSCVDAQDSTEALQEAQEALKQALNYAKYPGIKGDAKI